MPIRLFTKRLAACLLGATLCTLVAGCQIFGLAAHKLSGPEKVPALYVLPKVPTAIVVEDYGRKGASSMDCEELNRVLYRELNLHIATGEKPEELVPLISPDPIYRLRKKDPAAFRKMTIQEIGSIVGAKQIIYVDVLESSVEGAMAYQMIKASFSARVRVIETGHGETLWPADAADGYLVQIDTPYTETTRDQTDLAMRTEMLQAAGDEIAKMFYKWARPE